MKVKQRRSTTASKTETPESASKGALASTQPLKVYRAPIWYSLGNLFLGLLLLIAAFYMLMPATYHDIAARIVNVPQPLLVGLFCFFGLIFVLFYLVWSSVRLTLSEAGLTYYAVGYVIHTPWQNIAALVLLARPGPSQTGPVEGFKLKTKAALDLRVEEAMKRNVAAAEPARWLPRPLKERFPHTFPYTSVLPLDHHLVGRRWRQEKKGEFRGYLQRYAPQLNVNEA